MLMKPTNILFNVCLIFLHSFDTLLSTLIEEVSQQEVCMIKLKVNL